MKHSSVKREKNKSSRVDVTSHAVAFCRPLAVLPIT